MAAKGAWSVVEADTKGDRLVESLRDAGALDEVDRIYDAIERGENPLDSVDSDEMIADLRRKYGR